jgi:hypothetical protein
MAQLRQSPQSWRRDMDLLLGSGKLGVSVPVAVRAEIVNDRDGQALGFILTLQDLRSVRHAEAARQNLETSLRQAAVGSVREADEVISAILTNATLAAMDIADARSGPPMAPSLNELEVSTLRAAALYAQIRAFNG